MSNIVRFRKGSKDLWKRKSGARRRRGLKNIFRLFSFLCLAWLFSTGVPGFSPGLHIAPQTAAASNSAAPGITCANPHIIDGDTMDCGGHRIRLASIDTPEMPGHCRSGRRCTPGDPYASKSYLQSLMQGPVSCLKVDTDRYGRTVALCKSGGRDLSCAMVQSGHAVVRYGSLSCG